MSKSKTVHFTLDESTGVLLMNIAQEHLLYNYSPSRAIASIKNSLVGCSDEVALKILNGDMVIFVETDEETGQQSFMVTERNEDNTTIFPKLAIDYFAKHNIADITESGKNMVKGIKQTMNSMKYRDGLRVNHAWKSILNMAQGIEEDVLEEIRETDEYQEIVLLVQVVRDYITKSMNVLAVIDFCNTTWKYEYDTTFAKASLGEVGSEFGRLLREDYTKIAAKANETDNDDLGFEVPDLDKYIESAIESDKVSKEGIKPVNIMSNYSAGWLSPDGLFYGLNGEIANMLHNQIADMLQEAGQIPMYEGKDDERFFFKNAEDKRDAREQNPDAWLEQQGWVKIHGNNVQFAGCLNNVVDKKKKNVDMTPEQVKIIAHYIKMLHRGIISLGWKREKLSAVRFEAMAENNMPHLNKEYFQY